MHKGAEAKAHTAPSLHSLTGLLSNQGEKSINCSFIMVPLRKRNLSMGLQSPAERLPSHSSCAVSNPELEALNQNTQHGVLTLRCQVAYRNFREFPKIGDPNIVP